MIPDLSFVEETFNTYNALIFAGKLPTPRFRMTHAHTFHGKLVYRWKHAYLRKVYYDFEMRISLDFDLSEKEWEDVVIHEMIHLYITYNGIKDTSSHGPVFRQKMREINRDFNRHITVSGRASSAETESGAPADADKRVRGHYLCIAKFSDGRLGVAPAAKTRIFELWDIARFFPNVVSFLWIGSTDIWFNRFPRVMKPKLYLTSETELIPHLKGAVILMNCGNTIRAVSQRCSPDELLP